MSTVRCQLSPRSHLTAMPTPWPYRPHALCKHPKMHVANGINQGREFGEFTELLGKAECGQPLRLRPRSHQATAGGSVAIAMLSCTSPLWSDVVLRVRTESVASNYILLELKRRQRLNGALRDNGNARDEAQSGGRRDGGSSHEGSSRPAMLATR